MAEGPEEARAKRAEERRRRRDVAEQRKEAAVPRTADEALDGDDAPQREGGEQTQATGDGQGRARKAAGAVAIVALVAAAAAAARKLVSARRGADAGEARGPDAGEPTGADARRNADERPTADPDEGESAVAASVRDEDLVSVLKRTALDVALTAATAAADRLTAERPREAEAGRGRDE